MTEIHQFAFNPFQENTYLLINAQNECLIIDPGCYFPEEQQQFLNFIEKRQLKVVGLINTHAHLDHIFGNRLVYTRWKLKPAMHQAELPVLDAAPLSGQMYNIPFEPSPYPERFLTDEEEWLFGATSLRVIWTPGHSPGSICLYNEAERWLIGGDVLFRESIGRTDLPGGNFQTLETSIRQRLYVLPDDVVVYPGHGPTTTIGHEKQHNPFVRAITG
ncbi:MAG: MBL fold metallo-hydrolase [Thermoflavifilum sp.]|uniref:MBL fold metallo-hydrolase n=1 Tax=Thermoflavifilum sp. TaxID=1968839 RepID=UPI0018A37D22|nr:MBL fold metallo-hydrolase [Thermoflavifilum sp.]QOR76967.1 MAG: MBL fold metallo-hydrolase [Thermoflavifilum sp.]